MTVVSGSVTVGIDIGTTAVKAVAADETGTVLARPRIPRGPGLLYGDVRGRADPESGTSGVSELDAALPDAEGFVRWAVHHAPEARGYWPAQAVANYGLGRVPAIDTGTAMCMGSMRSGA